MKTYKISYCYSIFIIKRETIIDVEANLFMENSKIQAISRLKSNCEQFKHNSRVYGYNS